MKIKIIGIGQTDDRRMLDLCTIYEKRLKHYCPLELLFLSPKKKRTEPNEVIKIEGEALLSKIKPSSEVILLDEVGTQYSSIGFSKFLQQRMNASSRELIFLIGGAYGFSNEVIQRANHRLALSKMTFTHQMVRLIFLEQLYRAFTLIRGEKYHH